VSGRGPRALPGAGAGGFPAASSRQCRPRGPLGGRWAPSLAGEDKDYTIWLAHSSDPSNPSDGCVLGYKEQYRRLRKASACRNGRDYAVTKQPSVCPCTLEDFLW